MRDNTRELFRKIFAVLKPPPDLKLSEWADRFRRLAAGTTAEPGRWKTAKAPYQKEIMDAITDISIKKSRDYVCCTGRENGRNGAEPDRILYTL